MKILLWDLENSPIITPVWGLWEQNVSHKHILEDWKIICASFKWLHEPEVHNLRWKKTRNKEISPLLGWTDEPVVRGLHKVLSEADMIVAQNGDAFDWKKFQARALYFGLKPLAKIPSVDTLKTARKEFKLSSNKMDYIAKYLGHEGKMETPSGLWIDVIQGKPGALDTMVQYCDEDVLQLEKIYKDLLPYIRNHPDQQAYHGDLCCRNCGSKRLIKNGWRASKKGRVQRFQCQECGGWS